MAKDIEELVDKFVTSSDKFLTQWRKADVCKLIMRIIELSEFRKDVIEDAIELLRDSTKIIDDCTRTKIEFEVETDIKGCILKMLQEYVSNDN